jgi:ferredoxin-type protein NapH
MMMIIKRCGLVLFLVGLTLFTSLSFWGSYETSSDELTVLLTELEYQNIGKDLAYAYEGAEFRSPWSFSSQLMSIYELKNQELIRLEKWDEVMWTNPSEVALRVTQSSNHSIVQSHPWIWFFLTFGLAILGGLMYILPDVVLLGGPGIKNNGIYHHASTNRGWIGFVAFGYLIAFYVVLYFHPYMMVNQITLLQPFKNWFIQGEMASQWFLYGTLYCLVMAVMAVKVIIKYRHSRYQIFRTIVVLGFQIIFAFLLVEILPAFGLPGVDFKNAWPLDYDFLFDWNVIGLLESGDFGKFVFIWGILLSLVIVPILVYFWGKRWYCSWVCGCGGLAETLGDPYRHLSNKKLSAWRLERWLIHGVLIFAVIMTVFTGYHTYNEIHDTSMEQKDILFGISAFDVRQYYSFLIGAIFAGVIGTGFYPLFGNRVWCRFGCPLAAYMGLVQRFKSRFRITTNGGQCISCGNCSTYCEQGIDVRAYAQKGQNIVRSSCVGCGVCASVCPRGVLKLENGPVENRLNDNPIIIGSDNVPKLRV